MISWVSLQAKEAHLSGQTSYSDSSTGSHSFSSSFVGSIDTANTDSARVSGSTKTGSSGVRVNGISFTHSGVTFTNSYSSSNSFNRVYTAPPGASGTTETSSTSATGSNSEEVFYSQDSSPSVVAFTRRYTNGTFNSSTSGATLASTQASTVFGSTQPTTYLAPIQTTVTTVVGNNAFGFGFRSTTSYGAGTSYPVLTFVGASLETTTAPFTRIISNGTVQVTETYTSSWSFAPALQTQTLERQTLVETTGIAYSNVSAPFQFAYDAVSFWTAEGNEVLWVPTNTINTIAAMSDVASSCSSFSLSPTARFKSEISFGPLTSGTQNHATKETINSSPSSSRTATENGPATSKATTEYVRGASKIPTPTMPATLYSYARQTTYTTASGPNTTKSYFQQGSTTETITTHVGTSTDRWGDDDLTNVHTFTTGLYITTQSTTTALAAVVTASSTSFSAVTGGTTTVSQASGRTGFSGETWVNTAPRVFNSLSTLSGKEFVKISDGIVPPVTGASSLAGAQGLSLALPFTLTVTPGQFGNNWMIMPAVPAQFSTTQGGSTINADVLQNSVSMTIQDSTGGTTSSIGSIQAVGGNRPARIISNFNDGVLGGSYFSPERTVNLPVMAGRRFINKNSGEPVESTFVRTGPQSIINSTVDQGTVEKSMPFVQADVGRFLDKEPVARFKHPFPSTVLMDPEQY